MDPRTSKERRDNVPDEREDPPAFASEFEPELLPDAEATDAAPSLPRPGMGLISRC
jgi:hypothetical protein